MLRAMLQQLGRAPLCVLRRAGLTKVEVPGPLLHRLGRVNAQMLDGLVSRVLGPVAEGPHASRAIRPAHGPARRIVTNRQLFRSKVTQDRLELLPDPALAVDEIPGRLDVDRAQGAARGRLQRGARPGREPGRAAARSPPCRGGKVFEGPGRVGPGGSQAGWGRAHRHRVLVVDLDRAFGQLECAVDLFFRSLFLLQRQSGQRESDRSLDSGGFRRVRFQIGIVQASLHPGQFGSRAGAAGCRRAAAQSARTAARPWQAPARGSALAFVEASSCDALGQAHRLGLGERGVGDAQAAQRAGAALAGRMPAGFEIGRAPPGLPFSTS